MKTIEAYTLAELKSSHPDGYERAHNRWKEQQGDDIPWTAETMDSLKAVIAEFGGILNDWSIGAYNSESFVSVSVSDEFEKWFTDDEGDEDYHMIQKDAQWAIDSVLKPLGYPVSNVGHIHAKFPGLCKLTGYCADDDMLESVYKALEQGETLTDALQGLADVARIAMESNLEQQQSEDSMIANWEDFHFLADGTMI